MREVNDIIPKSNTCPYCEGRYDMLRGCLNNCAESQAVERLKNAAMDAEELYDVDELETYTAKERKLERLASDADADYEAAQMLDRLGLSRAAEYCYKQSAATWRAIETVQGA